MKLKTLVLALGLTSSAMLLTACGDKQGASENASATAEQTAPAAEQSAAQATQAAQDTAQAAQEESKSMMEKAQETVQAAAEQVQEKAQAAAEQAQDAASAVAETVNNATAAVAEAAGAAAAAATGGASGGVNGADVYGQCVGCHGPQGGGGVGPKLAGQSKEDIATKLRKYKAGEQIGPQTAMMAPMAMGLSDAEIDAVAEYIASNFQ